MTAKNRPRQLVRVDVRIAYRHFVLYDPRPDPESDPRLLLTTPSGDELLRSNGSGLVARSAVRERGSVPVTVEVYNTEPAPAEGFDDVAECDITVQGPQLRLESIEADIAAIIWIGGLVGSIWSVRGHRRDATPEKGETWLLQLWCTATPNDRDNPDHQRADRLLQQRP